MSQALSGQVAAVTGAASGIGLACAKALVREGASVVLVDASKGALDTACADLGTQALPLTIDLTNPSAVATMTPKILKRFGKLDIFHANAGVYIGGEVAEGDPDAWDRLLNLNINAAFRSVRAVLPHMVERKTGDIILTSSIAGLVPVVWEPIYTASKHAVQAFTYTVRRQVIKHGIRVGAVSPGPVITALIKDWPKAKLDDAIANGGLMEATEVRRGGSLYAHAAAKRHDPRRCDPPLQHGPLSHGTLFPGRGHRDRNRQSRTVRQPGARPASAIFRAQETTSRRARLQENAMHKPPASGLCEPDQRGRKIRKQAPGGGTPEPRRRKGQDVAKHRI